MHYPRYKSNPLFIDDMGSVPSFTVSNKPMETKEEELIWHINKMREHDGLHPLNDINDIEQDVTFTKMPPIPEAK